MKIVFCDDNSEFLLLLNEIVKKECQKISRPNEEIEIGPAFCSGNELIGYISQNHVDVVLLDIDMPKMSGFEVAKLLCDEYKDIKIIFMSAYDNLVYSTFEFYPFAFLRKSHISDELPKVLMRVMDKIREPYKRIELATTVGTKLIDVNSIVYVESDRNYYLVHLADSNELVCRGTIADFEKNVLKFDFFRIHSAYLVNLEHVERILENGCVLVKDRELPIAQRRIKSFKVAYMEYLRRAFGT